jgi:putative ABC transport system permease protein
MDALLRDIRYGLRMLFRNPGFASIAILSLALGIGANTAIFSVVNAFLFRPLPFAGPERLVHIWQTESSGEYRDSQRVAKATFLQWRDQARSFSSLGAYFYGGYNTSTETEPIRVQVGHVTANLMSLLGVEPELGRLFDQSEGDTGAKVVILGYDYWQTYFGGRRDALGEVVRLDGDPYTIIGVAPPDFVFPLQATRMWIPFPMTPDGSLPGQSGGLLIVGRLAEGVGLREAQAELDTIAERLAAAHPETAEGRGARVVPLREALVFFYDIIQLLSFALLVAVGFVLLIVCTNIGNLLLAHASTRHREVGIRGALGAGRTRLIRQFLTESSVLAFIGGVLGILLALWLTRALGPSIPADLYRAGEIGVDGSVMAYTVVLSVLAVLFFGFAPALDATRENLTETLKEGERGSGGSGRTKRLRNLLILVQFSFATVLLAGAIWSIRAFAELQDVHPGFDAERILTIELDIPSGRYPTDSEENLFYNQALERARSLPGVTAAAAVYPLPMNFELFEQIYQLPGSEPADPGENPRAAKFWITPDYFRTMGILLLEGRDFRSTDNESAAPVIIVNQRLAELQWPGGDALGSRVKLLSDRGDVDASVIGIVGNSKDFLKHEDWRPQIYLSQLQDSRSRRFIAARTEGDPLSHADGLRKSIWSIDRTIPITTVRGMDDVVFQATGPLVIAAAVLGLLGTGALFLAAMGIFGVTSYVVGQRTQEIGVRMAMGARRGDILRLVLHQAGRTAAIGLAIGLLIVFAATQAALLVPGFEGAFDPVMFLGTALLLLVVSFLAISIPARRAARVDPMTALRHH